MKSVAVSNTDKNSKKRANHVETAESMAGKQKEIAISEFFAKNRHLLGFDNPRKALLTTVKEAVDNSLDACEEAGVLPEVWVIIEALNGEKEEKKTPATTNNASLSKKRAKRITSSDTQQSLLPSADEPSSSDQAGSNIVVGNATRFRVTVRDNGPGIVKAQIPNVFGRLLYGSKFHQLRMSRGQQGIGISAAGMYGLLTTGQSVQIISRTGKHKDAHRFELQLDTLKNRPEILVEEPMASWKILPDATSGSIPADGLASWTQAVAQTNQDEHADEMEHGTEVSIVLEARFQRGRASVDEYLEQTAIANPHAQIHWIAPDGIQRLFPREVTEVPASPQTIKPHPYGVELGVLIRMLKETRHKQLGAFLQEEFSRVSAKIAGEIAKKSGLTVNTWCSQVARDEADRLHEAIQSTKIMAPPTDCLVPIGPQQILKGLLKEIKAEFYTAETRSPAVYRGNPFQIEVGLAFGGDLPSDNSARVIRFANRVPLLYQPSACCITKSIIGTNWRNYGTSQPRNALPEGPLVIFVHMASVWVPFTSESKEAIADYDEISKEIKLAIKECGRKLNTYIRRRQRIAREGQRRHVFEKYIGEVVMACEKMTKLDPEKLYEQLREVAKSRTATADTQFDENGNPIHPAPTVGKLAGDENVVVIEANQHGDTQDASGHDDEEESSEPGEQLFAHEEGSDGSDEEAA